jgi:hypothetical protein
MSRLDSSRSRPAAVRRAAAAPALRSAIAATAIAVSVCTLLALLACADPDLGPTTPTPVTWLGFDDPTAYASGGVGVTSLAARDVTGDGLPDLIAVARGEGVHILPGSASGTFGAAVAWTVGVDPLRAVTGDVDGDGVPDLVVIGHFDNAFHVRRGLGHGTFDAAVRYPLRNHGREIAVADLNGDHIDDVVAVHDGSGQPIWISVFLGSASGAMRPVWETGTPFSSSQRVVVADLDAGERRVDIDRDQREGVPVPSQVGVADRPAAERLHHLAQRVRGRLPEVEHRRPATTLHELDLLEQFEAPAPLERVDVLRGARGPGLRVGGPRECTPGR